MLLITQFYTKLEEKHKALEAEKDEAEARKKVRTCFWILISLLQSDYCRSGHLSFVYYSFDRYSNYYFEDKSKGIIQIELFLGTHKGALCYLFYIKFMEDSRFLLNT